VFRAGLSCGRDVCQFTLSQTEEKMDSLRGAATKITDKVTKTINNLMQEDTLDCSAGDLRDVEQKGHAKINEIREEMVSARREIMDTASARLEKMMLRARRMSQESCTLRKKAFQEYHAEVGTVLTYQVEQSDKKAELVARAQALEVCAIMTDLQVGTPGTSTGKGGGYGPDFTNTRYGKGDGRAEPYREPGQAAASGAVLRPNRDRQGRSDRIEIRAPAPTIGVTCFIAGRTLVKTDDAYIRGGVIDDNRGGRIRAAVTKQIDAGLWYRGSPIAQEGHRYFDGKNQEERLIMKQVAIDHLIDDQMQVSEEKRAQFRQHFRMSVEDSYTQERQALRVEVVHPAIIKKNGTYPWFMWEKAHHQKKNRVFQREAHHQKKNRGINNELCVVNIPNNFVSNLRRGSGWVVGVSCYTVYIKGIPWDFHKGSFIKKCLEYGPLAACYLGREADTDRLTGIAYVKVKYPCSVEAMINDWTVEEVRDERGRLIQKGWRVRAHGGQPRTIYAVYSRVEVVFPGYPTQHRNQMSENPDVRRWAIALNFNVTPRYAGEFTKELLQWPWLWGNTAAPVTGNTEPETTAAAPSVTGSATAPSVTGSGPPSAKSEVDEISNHS